MIAKIKLSLIKQTEIINYCYFRAEISDGFVELIKKKFQSLENNH
jgi:hypothetical protein